MKEKVCLILEGGGSKCAYQSGVLKVLHKAGYRFKGVGGTSFGAVNGAMYISNRIKKLDLFWKKIKPSVMFNEEKLDSLMEQIFNKEFSFDKETMKFALSEWKDAPSKLNEISEQYYQLIRNCVDEKRIRKSNIDFGLVTIALPKKSKIFVKSIKALLNPLEILKSFIFDNNIMFDSMEMIPVELTKNHIPKGKMKEFVIASACIPPFKPIKIDGVEYLDGGYYDNIPIKLMSKLGYTKFFVIRTNPGIPKIDGIDKFDIKYICPKNDLGSCAMFAQSNIFNLRKQGYNDAIEFVNNELGDSLIWKLRRKVLLRKSNKALPFTK